MASKFGYAWGEIRKGFDRSMVVIMVILFVLGLLTIYSAGDGVRRATSGLALKQLVWGVIGACCYVVVLRVGYENFVRWGYGIYFLTLGTLLLLLIVGSVTKGAQSWFRIGGISFQPSELGKIALILCLSRFLSRYPPDTVRNLCAALAISGISVLLIMLQPDLGSALVYVTVIFAMLAVAGTPGLYLAGLVAVGVAMLPIFWNTLKTYQKLRLIVFLDPYIDPQGAGYNVIQSRIAVGSGGLWGKGYLSGTQGRLHFLPEPQTDFIFSVFAEEFGFVGSLCVVLLFACLLWRLLRAAFRVRDTKAKLLCVGVGAWMWFQVMESIAMSMGLAPITGLPLPLFSYGGSSLLMAVLGLALVQSVAIAPVKDKLSALS